MIDFSLPRPIGRRLFFVAVFSALLALGPASAATCPTPPVRGINLVPLPTGWYNNAVELQFPTGNHIAYYQQAGLTRVRLPIVWETIQPQLFGPLDARYLANARAFLDAARSRGARVLIDLHNYGRYRDKLVGSPEVPASAFKDIWQRLAAAFGDHSAVYAFGLMNEPHDTGGLWHQVAQQGVDGIRTVDKTRDIYVAGDSWSNAQLWPKVNPRPFVSDPQQRIVYEAHLYFDDDFSGRYRGTPDPNVDLAARGVARLTPFIDWLKTHGQRGAIGETGVPMGDPRWLDAFGKFIDLAEESCLGWFVWAGGRWRDTYELSHEPIDGQDRPQIRLIRQKLTGTP